jgi:hypothetical protein
MAELLDVLPADRRETARSALAAAFGATPLTALQPVTGGASGALIYRIEIDRKPYLFRMEMRRSPFRNPHQYVCMQTAVDAGIAPPVHHLDPVEGIVIMDFMPQRPLTEYPGGPMALARGLGRLIARLQATPVFPELRDYLVILDRMLGFIRGSNMFAAGLLDAHAAGFERIRKVYPWNPSALVSSHNDPNPRNIIFDGERLWLIDWETAFRNDPLTDVAIVAENFGTTPELEDALLEGWLSRTPDRPLRARLVLMRQLTRLFYAGILLGGFAGAPRTAPDGDLTAPTADGFRAAIAEGRLKAGSPEIIYTLGKMFLAGFLAGLAAPEFEYALSVCQR